MYLRLQVISHAPVLQCISCTFIVIVFPDYQALKSPIFLPWLEIPVLYCSQKISNSGYRFVYSRQPNNSCVNASAKLRDYYTSHLCIGFYWKNSFKYKYFPAFREARLGSPLACSSCSCQTFGNLSKRKRKPHQKTIPHGYPVSRYNTLEYFLALPNKKLDGINCYLFHTKKYWRITKQRSPIRSFSALRNIFRRQWDTFLYQIFLEKPKKEKGFPFTHID